ncbi:MAG: hypothetical protein HRU19_10170 [Pseudobacteriovorax sp.]|nr:hypothetical protein [Pseudobacteriovorax sp.]
MVHWNLIKRRQILFLQFGLLACLVLGFTIFQGMEGQANSDRLEIIEEIRLPIKEVSGLAYVRSVDGAFDIAAVGDKKAEILIYNTGLKTTQLYSFAELLFERFSLCFDETSADCVKIRKKISSDWEAIVVDNDGSFHIMQEHSQAIITLNSDVSEILSITNFDLVGDDSKLKKSSSKIQSNSLGEGFIKQGENFIVAKEMYPLSFVEIGESKAVAKGFSQATQALSKESTDAKGQNLFRRKLDVLSKWELSGHSKCDFSELAVRNGKLLALSQKCKKLMVFSELPTGKNKVVPEQVFPLPKKINSPEALAVLPDGTIAIGSDIKKKKTNLFILKFHGESP